MILKDVDKPPVFVRSSAVLVAVIISPEPGKLKEVEFSARAFSEHPYPLDLTNA